MWPGAERPDVHYSLVAVDFMSAEALYGSLTRLSANVANGSLAPLPFIQHSMNSVTAALRQMSQARHVGKIVVSLPVNGRGIRPAGKVLVTGAP